MRRDVGLPTACWLAFLLAAVPLAACSGGSSERPASLAVYAEPSLVEPAVAAATELLAGADIAVEQAAAPEQAGLVVTSTPPAGVEGVEFPARYWVAAVDPPDPARNVSASQLADATAGRLTDWSSITGETLPLRVLVPLDPAPPLAQWWPDQTAVVEDLPLSEIPRALKEDPGALALLPLDAVDAGARTLDIDGANPVFGRGDLAAYPLVERAWAVPQSDQFGGLLDELADGLAQRLAVTPPDPIIMRATGDIIPARCAYARQRDYGDFAHAFRELGPWLAEADLTVGSLDAALSDAGEPFGCEETFSLLAPAATVDGLALAGFDVITVATNHVKDCGRAACGDQAFFDTLANLRAQGIEPVGGGANLSEARRPGIVTVGGVRFAFLGYDQIAPYYHAEPDFAGTAPLDESFLREDVAAAARQADVVIVLPQWGVEYTADPTLDQQALAAAAIESGADLIIGNHPHWVQASELIDGVFVAYALGNFVFDQDWSLETQQGVVLEAAFHGPEVKGIEYYPVHIIDEHQPVFAGPDEAQQILDRIWTASAALRVGLP